MEVEMAKKILAGANRFSIATDQARTRMNLSDEQAVELAQEILDSVEEMDTVLEQLAREENQVA